MSLEERLTPLFETTKLWKIWIIGLLISFTIIITITHFTIGVVELLQLIGIILLSLLFSLILPSMISIFRLGNKFYRKADTIEIMIKNGESEVDVYNELIKLDREAFHKTMGGRVRELVEMYKLQYKKY